MLLIYQADKPFYLEVTRKRIEDDECKGDVNNELISKTFAIVVSETRSIADAIIAEHA